MNLSTLLYRHQISLGNKIIDLGKPEIRSRITGVQLEELYQEWLKDTERIASCFQDGSALERAIQEVKGNRPPLIARTPNYPLNPLELERVALDFYINPGKIRESKYFTHARSILKIPLREGSPFRKLVDGSIPIQTETLEQRIEIPNDLTHAEAKESTYHELLHCLMVWYQFHSKQLFTNEEFVSTEERYKAEHWINEIAVNALTEVMLEGDKEALLEYRWRQYGQEHQELQAVWYTATALLAGITMYTYPLALPIIYGVGVSAYNYYKSTKKEELTKEGKELVLPI